jgi:DNA-binding XRE family transcriptional regulator
MTLKVTKKGKSAKPASAGKAIKDRRLRRDAKSGAFLAPSRASAASVLTQVTASLDRLQAELDHTRDMVAQIVAADDPEDAADMATVAHVRGLIASGSEEVIPAEVVARLDAGDSPIRVFREFRRMTQGQLADAVDLDQSFISKIEAGTKHPTAANLGRLARALKVDADLLLPDED